MGPSLPFLIFIVSTTQPSFIFPYDLLFPALKNFWIVEDMSREKLVMGIYLGDHGVHPPELKINGRRPENSLPLGFYSLVLTGGVRTDVDSRTPDSTFGSFSGSKP